MITVIANLKGGSGKSTVAFNLAVWLEKNAVPVVGYDLDPQCTFSDLAMLRKEEGKYTGSDHPLGTCCVEGPVTES